MFFSKAQDGDLILQVSSGLPGAILGDSRTAYWGEQFQQCLLLFGKIKENHFWISLVVHGGSVSIMADLIKRSVVKARSLFSWIYLLCFFSPILIQFWETIPPGPKAPVPFVTLQKKLSVLAWISFQMPRGCNGSWSRSRLWSFV